MTRAWPHTSLRGRLLVGTLVGIAAALALTGWALGGLFRDHVHAQFQAELRHHLDQLTAQVGLDDRGAVMVSAPLADPRFARPLSGMYWQIDRLAPTPQPALARSRSLWDETLDTALLPAASAAPASAADTGNTYPARLPGPGHASLGAIARTVQLDDQHVRLSVAADEALVMEPVARFHRAMWLALALLGIGLAGAAVVQVVMGLAPLRAMRRQLEAIRDGRQTRLQGHFPDEVAPLADELNAVLDHQAQSVQRARTHAGNLAHALKTPLSVLTNAAHARDPDLPALVRTQVELARRHVDYHLARAQAAARRPSGTRCAVAPVVAGLLRVMPRLYAARSLTLEQGGEPARFAGDEHDLHEMLGNLIDNACKWARARVRVTTQLRHGRLVIDIEDDGPGIAADARARLRQRGARADEAIPGTGLGLAIVDDLAHAYGGGLTLDGSPLGGLCARLTLPGDAPASDAAP